MEFGWHTNVNLLKQMQKHAMVLVSHKWFSWDKSVAIQAIFNCETNECGV